MADDTDKKGGRGRADVSVRIPEWLRMELQLSANAAGHSMNAEVNHRLSHSYEMNDLVTEVLGGPDERYLLEALAAALRVAKVHARARDFDEEQTRRMIRSALHEIVDVHLWSGEILQRPLRQILFMEHGKMTGLPDMPPDDAGSTLALDTMVSRQDAALDEVNMTPLERRWSRPKSGELVGEAEAGRSFRPDSGKGRKTSRMKFE